MTQNSQYRHVDEIIEKIHKVLGLFPGYRTLHADGRFYKGTFRATAAARDYTRAIHLQTNFPFRCGFRRVGATPSPISAARWAWRRGSTLRMGA